MNVMNMNPNYGKKWFVFYTKVRPWLTCVSAISIFGDFFQSTNEYFQNGWLMLFLVNCVILVVLEIKVFLKSKGDYTDFLDFVKGVLIFEVISFSYQATVPLLIGLGFGYGVLIFLICFLVLYFLWYRLNIKYFEKRRLPYTSEIDDDRTETKTIESNNSNKEKILFCRKCGKKLEEDAMFCNKCGTKIIA